MTQDNIKFEDVKKDAVEAGSYISRAAKSAAQFAQSKVRETAKVVKDDAQTTFNSIKEGLGEGSPIREGAGQRMKDAKETLRKKEDDAIKEIRHRPKEAVLAAGAMGLVLGAALMRIKR